MRALLPIALILAPSLAQAEPPDEVTVLFREGRRQYLEHHYREAIDLFTEGYKKSAKPEFLLNLGQCHREVGDHEKAIDAYRRFLVEANATHPLREAALTTLHELEQEAPPPKPPERPKRKLALAISLSLTSIALVATAVGVGAYYGTRPAPLTSPS